jgi:DNA invertase Pin-like site-specific DNA recombinase
MVDYVIYKRVSTNKQSASGLGMDAQDRDIDIFLHSYNDSPFDVLGVFVEVITGKDTGELKVERQKAIELAKSNNATLLVAKLDRLSRDVEDIAGIIKRVDLKVASMPHADKFQLHLYAALAEQEREFISQRTKTALNQAKAKGVKLGGLRDSTMQRNLERKNRANLHAKSLELLVKPLRAQGKSYNFIAEAMNDAGIKTRQGCKWSPMQIKRVVDRLSFC